jgi:hypothetical protein
MEPVHFVGAGSGVFVLEGKPPEGIIGRLLDPFTSSLVKTESGVPLLDAVKQRHMYPGMHCRHCRQIILRYNP